MSIMLLGVGGGGERFMVNNNNTYKQPQTAAKHASPFHASSADPTPSSECKVIINSLGYETVVIVLLYNVHKGCNASM